MAEGCDAPFLPPAWLIVHVGRCVSASGTIKSPIFFKILLSALTLGLSSFPGATQVHSGKRPLQATAALTLLRCHKGDLELEAESELFFSEKAVNRGLNVDIIFEEALENKNAPNAPVFPSQFQVVSARGLLAQRGAPG